jgi:hypothetical protein
MPPDSELPELSFAASDSIPINKQLSEFRLSDWHARCMYHGNALVSDDTIQFSRRGSYPKQWEGFFAPL